MLYSDRLLQRSGPTKTRRALSIERASIARGLDLSPSKYQIPARNFGSEAVARCHREKKCIARIKFIRRQQLRKNCLLQRTPSGMTPLDSFYEGPTTAGSAAISASAVC